VAVRANVPFFSISAAEFSRRSSVSVRAVRDLFDQAKQVAPSIIFIEKLDAIGRARGGAQSIGGQDEREQTLNQILTEMDGFTANEGVVVLAATNRPEILDPALLRPGRFDRRVTVSATRAGMAAEGSSRCMSAAFRWRPMSTSETLPASTPGMVGADLKNLVNEAALFAARREHDQVTASDFSDALEKVVLGTVRGIMLSARGKEAHGVSRVRPTRCSGCSRRVRIPVRKVSVIPRGQALGATFQSPRNDRYGYSSMYLRGRIVGALGGESGGTDRLRRRDDGRRERPRSGNDIARQMVGRWGMSETIGPVSVLPPPGQEVALGLDGVAPATKELVDTEVAGSLTAAMQRPLRHFNATESSSTGLARTLIERETLNEEERYAAAGIRRDTAPAALARGESSGHTGVMLMATEVWATVRGKLRRWLANRQARRTAH
jgi:cell division protease FtsH